MVSQSSKTFVFKWLNCSELCWQNWHTSTSGPIQVNAKSHLFWISSNDSYEQFRITQAHELTLCPNMPASNIVYAKNSMAKE